jgi:hypothetical protein
MARHRKSVLIAAIAVCSAATLTFAQQGTRDQRAAAPGQPQPPAGTAVIAGAVTSADLGRPVARARVTLRGGDRAVTRTALADPQGAFSFDALGPGEYTLVASKPGYLESTFGQKQPGSGRPGTSIRLLDGQRLERVQLPLARGGVITGVIRDENGEPAYGVAVRLYRYVMRSGERSLQPAGTTTTDDRGIYRAPLLMSGDYIVTATPRQDVFDAAMALDMRMRYEVVVQAMQDSGRAVLLAEAPRPPAEAGGPTTGYATVYYPGTTQASAATTVTVGVGEERSGIDLQMQLVPTSGVTGVVMGPEGPYPGASVQLIDHSQLPGMGVRSARTGADGRFSFAALPPGQYTLLARGAPRGARQLEASAREAASTLARAGNEARAAQVAQAIAAVTPPLWAQLDVSTDGRTEPEIVLSMQPGMSISGSVVFEGGSGAPNTSRMSVTIVPVGSAAGGELGAAPPSPVDANGRFAIRGVMPGRYRVVASAGVPAGFTLQSSMFAGRDSLDMPIEVRPGEDVAGGVLTFSTQTTELSGTLQDATGQPAPGYTVIAFSSDERFWLPQSRRVQAARPATDGRFVMRNLPPGEYRLAAVTDVEPGQWFDPEFLRQLLSASTPVRISEAGKTVQDLRVR